MYDQFKLKILNLINNIREDKKTILRIKKYIVYIKELNKMKKRGKESTIEYSMQNINKLKEKYF